MSIWGLLIVWLGGWALIILLHTIAIALFSRQTNAKIWEDEFLFHKKEMVDNGNNLFTTGLVYFALNLICHFWNNNIVYWILFVGSIAFTILPLTSVFAIAIQTIVRRNKYAVLNCLSCILETFIPIVMSLNILFVYILK